MRLAFPTRYFIFKNHYNPQLQYTLKRYRCRMINYHAFFEHIARNALSDWQEDFQQAIDERIHARTHGDLPQWQAVLDALPEMPDVTLDANQDTVTLQSSISLTETEKTSLQSTLMGLHPWRKGPFRLFDLFIDTEWRSDWKWQRIAPHLSDLTDRMVLDVGCGSGYHCWRMRGAGARFVLGIDPSPKFLFQFDVFKRYLPKEPVYLLPLMSEDLPNNMACFDTVFSMGVLYHRRSPFDHIDELKSALRKGGELVLETLVVDGDEHTVFLPEGRYAQMRNVWFLPSALALEAWLKRLGFINIRTVDIDQTSLQEQRTTEWMTYQSLQDFLDPDDHDKTLEGHPAPKRAVVIAEKA